MLDRSLAPLTDRFDRFEARMEARFERMDEIYARKDVTNLRFLPLEQAAMTKNQRIGVLVGGIIGGVGALINFTSFIIHFMTGR